MNRELLGKIFEKGYILGLSDSMNGIHIKFSDIIENFLLEWEKEQESKSKSKSK